MALEVGGVVARLGAKLDDSGFDRFDRRMDQAERRGRKGVVARARADTRDAERGLGNFDKSMDRSERRGGRFRTAVSSTFGGVRFAALGMASAATGAVALVGKSFVDTAADIGESESKLRTILGGSSKIITDFSKTSARELGLSRSTALEAAGSFAGMFDLLGKSHPEAAKMSVNMTKLAADMASFNNAKPEEALEALQAGLRGEAEPLRRFNVLLDDATLRQQAVKDGLIKTTKEALTPQQKAMASYSVILEQTKTQQGDFARTSEGLPNQLRIMRARFSDLGATIGEKLLPVVNGAVKGLNGLLSGEGLGRGGGALAKVRGALGGVRDWVGGLLRDNQENLDDLKRAWGSLVAPIRRVVDQVTSAVRNAFGRGGMGRDLRQIINALADVATAFQTAIVVPLVRRVLPAVSTALRGLVQVVRGVVRVIAGILTLDFGKAWSGIKDIVGGALKIVGGAIRGATAPIRAAAAALWGAMSRPARVAFDFILGGVTSVMGALEDMARVGSKLPGVGGKFKGLADDIAGARKSIDRYRESLRDTDKEHGKRANINRLRDDVDRLRRKLSDTRKGTESYRQTAEKLRSKQRALNDAMKDAKPGADRAARGIRGVDRAADAAADGVAAAGASIAGNVNRLARELGAKGIRFTPAKTKAGQRSQSHNFGSVQDTLDANPIIGRNRGGLIPGMGLEDTELVAAAPGEAFLTRHHQGPVEEALALRAMLLGGPGSLDELFAGDQRAHGSGAPAAIAGLTRYQQGGIVPVPGFPGERANRSILGKIAAIVRRFPGLILTDAYGQGHKSPGHTRFGTAADFAGPDRVMTAAAHYLAGQGYTVGYDGTGGTQAWPGHGPRSRAGSNAHLHAELGGPGGALAAVANIARLMMQGPAGALRDVTQGAADKMRRMGNAFVGRINPVPVGGGGGGALSREQIEALAGRALERTGLFPNTPANRAALADRALQESGGRPGVTQGVVDVNTGVDPAVGLMQMIGATFATHRDRRLPNDRRNPFASMVAAIRYMKAKYGHIVGATGSGYQRGGRLGRVLSFNRGGRKGKGKRKLPTTGQALRELDGGTKVYGRLRNLQTDRVEDYDRTMGDVQTLQDDYSYFDRLYGMSDEELVDEETGAVNAGAVRERAGELEKLLTLRRKIRNRLEKARAIIARVIKSYTTMIKRLSTAKRAVKGKKGFRRQRTAYYDRLIASYRERRGEWQDKTREALTSWRDSRLDVMETEQELAGVRGTTARPADETAGADTTVDVLDAAAAELATGDTAGAGADDTNAAPDPVAVAEAAAAELRAFSGARGEAYGAFGSNFTTGYSRPGDRMAAAAGASNYGAFGGAEALEGGAAGGVAAGQVVVQGDVVNHFAAPPPEPHVWVAQQAHDLKAL